MNREFGDADFCGSPRKTLTLEVGLDREPTNEPPSIKLILLKGVNDQQVCALSQQCVLAQLIKHKAPAVQMEGVELKSHSPSIPSPPRTEQPVSALSV